MANSSNSATASSASELSNSQFIINPDGTISDMGPTDLVDGTRQAQDQSQTSNSINNAFNINPNSQFDGPIATDSLQGGSIQLGQGNVFNHSMPSSSSSVASSSAQPSSEASSSASSSASAKSSEASSSVSSEAKSSEASSSASSEAKSSEASSSSVQSSSASASSVASSSASSVAPSSSVSSEAKSSEASSSSAQSSSASSVAPSSSVSSEAKSSSAQSSSASSVASSSSTVTSSSASAVSNGSNSATTSSSATTSTSASSSSATSSSSSTVSNGSNKATDLNRIGDEKIQTAAGSLTSQGSSNASSAQFTPYTGAGSGTSSASSSVTTNPNDKAVHGKKYDVRLSDRAKYYHDKITLDKQTLKSATGEKKEKAEKALTHDTKKFDKYKDHYVKGEEIYKNGKAPDKNQSIQDKLKDDKALMYHHDRDHFEKKLENASTKADKAKYQASFNKSSKLADKYKANYTAGEELKANGQPVKDIVQAKFDKEAKAASTTTETNLNNNGQNKASTQKKYASDKKTIQAQSEKAKENIKTGNKSANKENEAEKE